MDGIIPPNQNDQPHSQTPSVDPANSTPNESEAQNSIHPGLDTTTPENLATDADAEADEAVVAGVAAVGGIALKVQHILNFFKNWWKNKKIRYVTLSTIAVVVAVIFLVPFTRYGVLNAMGFNGTVNVTVVDADTRLPLKDATVSIGGVEAKTNNDGYAVVESSKLGNQELVITKPGYGDDIEERHVGIGTNNFGEVLLVATGTRFTFKIVDYHSGAVLPGALAEVGEASAFADETGLLKLVIPSTDRTVSVSFSSKGYRKDVYEIAPDVNEQQIIKLVTDGWHAFISKRDGNFDLYRVNYDGKNVSKVFLATGNERVSSLSLLPSQDGRYAALVSTRDAERNNDGYELSGLYIIDMDNTEGIRVDLAESIELHGWVDNQLIYLTQASGESGFSANRLQLKRFLLGNLTGEKLIGSNYFNGVILAKGRVYFGPSQSFKQTQPEEAFISFAPDGSDQQTHIRESVGRIVRNDFDKLIVETYDESDNYKSKWYEFVLSTQTARRLDGRPVTLEYWDQSGDFVESQNGLKTAWLDERDGNKVIIVHGDDGTDKEIWRGQGAVSPLRWIGNDLIVFRVVKDGVFDFIVSASGGEAVKLTEATNVRGAGTRY